MVPLKDPVMAQVFIYIDNRPIHQVVYGLFRVMLKYGLAIC